MANTLTDAMQLHQEAVFNTAHRAELIVWKRGTQSRQVRAIVQRGAPGTTPESSYRRQFRLTVAIPNRDDWGVSDIREADILELELRKGDGVRETKVKTIIERGDFQTLLEVGTP